MKEKRTVSSPFLGRFLLTSSLGRRRVSVYISLFTLAIPINYTSEFRGRFEIYVYIYIFIYLFIYLCGFSALGAACWPLVPSSRVQTRPKPSDF